MTRSIEADRLRKTYPPSVTALDGVSLTVGAGAVFGLLGPNGAGKSTTVRVLSTMTRPDSGGATVAGIDVLSNPAAVRRAIGVVGQKHGADPAATGRENLVLQGEFHGMTGRSLKQRIAESLQRHGLADVVDRPARTYSGGQQRRLDIAMGLLHEPKVLFLDEPTTGLDPEARLDLWGEVERLAGDDGITILLTTHNLEEAERLASRLAIIDQGRVVAEGTPDALKQALDGDTITVELATVDEHRARATLGRISGIDGVVLDGRTLRAHAHDGGAAIPAVLAALDAQGVKAASVTLARPSLDEVYLRHAGRAFRSADESPRERVA